MAAMQEAHEGEGEGEAGLACVSCGEPDVRQRCELCEGTMCGECYRLVRGDVLLCLGCAEVLGPCSVCDGPTGPPLDLEAVWAGAVVAPSASAPPPPRQLPQEAREGEGGRPARCPACDDLYCADCALPGGRCPFCGAGLVDHRGGSGSAEGVVQGCV
jgi:hypothetical protein